MDRLTYRNKNGDVGLIGEKESLTSIEVVDLINNALDKLFRYEELEGDGRLIEQKHGEWKPVGYDSKCSACGYIRCEPLMIMRREFKYCPNCGVKMELKELKDEQSN